MNHYTVAVSTPVSVPPSVLKDAIAKAVYNVTKLHDERKPRVRVFSAGGYIARNHPFEGPVINDDLPPVKVIPLSEQAKAAVSRAIGEDFPRLKELFAAKSENPPLTRETLEKALAVRQGKAPVPEGEGDWQLTGDDKVGEDV